MTPDELKKLEAEVAALEKQVSKRTGKPVTPPKTVAPKRKAKATTKSNDKAEMPAKGSVEWEAWQASKLQESGNRGPTLLQKMKLTLDQQLRRAEQLHLGSKERAVATGRAEGLACAVGILRGTTMSSELRNAHNRIGGESDSGGDNEPGPKVGES